MGVPESILHSAGLSKLEVSHPRMLGEVRVALSLGAILLLLTEPTGLRQLVVFVVLLAYSVVSFWRLLLWNRGHADAFASAIYWLDAAVYGLVVAMTGGFASDFLFFLLFPIAVASFQGGFQRGALVALGCTLLLFGTGTAPLWHLPDSDRIKLLLGPATVLLLGLIIARWGESESTLTRRLAFLDDLNRLACARNGVREVVCGIAETLRAYQRADACIVILKDDLSNRYYLYRAGDQENRIGNRGAQVGQEFAASLLTLPTDQVALYGRRGSLGGQGAGSTYHFRTLERLRSEGEPLEELANLLETDSFITLPLRASKQVLGRVFLTSSSRGFNSAEVGYLIQAMGQAALVIRNTQLGDRIVFAAANEERRKISRDLHDGTIQPYIGLKLALEALGRKFGSNHAVAAEVDQLTRMADDGIDQLRSYVGRLRGPGTSVGRDLLVPAVQRQASKFTEFYGINVEVGGDKEITVPVRLVDEIMQIVREGLSNIRRHSSAEHAAINLQNDDKRLVVEFVQEENDGDGSNRPASFFPRSLNERARELGGRVAVEQRPDGRTAVTVEIPT